MSALALLVSLVAVLVLGACGDDDTVATTGGVTEQPTGEAPDAGGTDDGGQIAPAADGREPVPTGIVAVGLEPVDGVFIEGFEVGLRFETTDGEVIASTLWSDFVVAQGELEPESFYESVLEQVVPAGEVVVLATVNIGMGPGPEIPDLDGTLDCRLLVEVPDAGTVPVEVAFTGTADCLRPA